MTFPQSPLFPCLNILSPHMYSCPYAHHPHGSLALHAQSQPWGFKGCRNRAWPCLGIGAQGQAFLLAHPQPCAMLLHSTIFTSYY